MDRENERVHFNEIGRNNQMKKWLTVLLITVVSFLVACSSDSSLTPKNSEETTEGEEKIEGTVQFYTSQPDADAESLVQAFEKKYPSIQVEIFRSGTEEVIGKVLAEEEAGGIQADVLLVADAVTFEMLKKQDLLQAYRSQEEESIPEQFVDPDHMYYGTKAMATIIATNDEVTENIPTKWADLLEKQEDGKTVMPSPLYSGAAAYNVGVFTRNSLGWDMFKSLKDNNLMVVQGNGAALKEVQSGQRTHGIVVDFIVARAIQEGSPLTLTYPEEGVPVITEPVALMKGSKNEEAAKLLIDFILSKEGQELARSLGYTPIREDVEAPEGLKSISEMKVLEADLQELVDGREEDKKQFKELIGE